MNANFQLGSLASIRKHYKDSKASSFRLLLAYDLSLGIKLSESNRLYILKNCENGSQVIKYLQAIKSELSTKRKPKT